MQVVGVTRWRLLVEVVCIYLGRDSQRCRRLPGLHVSDMSARSQKVPNVQGQLGLVLFCVSSPW